VLQRCRRTGGRGVTGICVCSWSSVTWCGMPREIQ